MQSIQTNSLNSPIVGLFSPIAVGRHFSSGEYLNATYSSSLDSPIDALFSPIAVGRHISSARVSQRSHHLSFF